MSIKVLIFGALIRGKRLYSELSINKYQILGFVDNDTELAGQKLYDVPIFSLNQIMSVG
jgi:FlaA1/EpsC-like NDP-sugar epimerase